MLARFSSNAILAKAHAMYAGRLTEHDYADLLNCKSVGEIAAYLKSRTVYADVLQDAVAETLHREQLEGILKKRLFAKYGALCRYEMSIGVELYRCFILQADIEEILTCIRFLSNGHPGDYLFALPPFLNEHTQLNLYALAEVKDLDDVLRVLNGTPYFTVLEPLVRDGKAANFLRVESAFKRFEYRQILEIIDQVFKGEYKQDVLRFFHQEIDTENIINIYRLKHTLHADPETISELIVTDGGTMQKYEIEYLMGASSDGEFLSRLKSMHYGRLLGKNAYSYMEEGVQKVRYDIEKKAFRFSNNPYVVMFSYIFLAKNEVKNITHIIEGIRYAIPSEVIRTLLIGVES